MFTVDRDGDGINDSEDDGIEPIGVPWAPSSSMLGAHIQRAIELDCGFKITCGSCLKCLRSLNHTTDHDPDEITTRLLVELQLPLEKRKELSDMTKQTAWLRRIVTESLKSIETS